MSIEKYDGKLQMLCDECGLSFEKSNGKALFYEIDEFDIMIADAMKAGWIRSRDSKCHWEHHCPDCVP